MAWPLGYNETIEQAEQIVANYSTSYVDLLLIHWPVNYGPCSFHGPNPSIPTTDPSCDTSLQSYSPKECRLSTWRALVSVRHSHSHTSMRSSSARADGSQRWSALRRCATQVWKRGLARAIGVSNFNSTHIQEIIDAGMERNSNPCSISDIDIRKPVVLNQAVVRLDAWIGRVAHSKCEPMLILALP